MSAQVIQAELPPELLRSARAFASKSGRTDLSSLVADALRFYIVTHVPPASADTSPPDREQALQALAAQADSCAQPGWDGHGAEPVTVDACRNACRVVTSLPGNLPMPTIGAEPDGHLTLEWYHSPSRVLSLSVGPGGELNYAALLGDTSRRTGSEVLGTALPHDLLELINEVLAA